jgi:hypothetical protein
LEIKSISSSWMTLRSVPSMQRYWCLTMTMCERRAALMPRLGDGRPFSPPPLVARYSWPPCATPGIAIPYVFCS